MLNNCYHEEPQSAAAAIYVYDHQRALQQHHNIVNEPYSALPPPRSPLTRLRNLGSGSNFI